MSDSDPIFLHQKSNIAELNSLTLFDYERSFKKHYNNTKRTNSEFYKWFDHSKFDKSKNFFLNDYKDYFLNVVFKSFT
jgi:hypothetical protein